MLLPAEVLSLLFHEDPTFRWFALTYFSEAHDRAPLTADDLWAAADRVHGDDRLFILRDLSRLPSTPTSRVRLLEGLRSEPDADLFHHLCAALGRLSGDDLRRALGEPRIARRLAPTARAALDEALHLAGQSFDELWETVETTPIEVKDERWLLEPKAHRVGRLARALARFPEQAAARALDALLDPPGGPRTRWLQYFSVQLLEYVSHPGTLVPLLAVAGNNADQFFMSTEWALDALVHLGTREVVAAMAAGFSGGRLRSGAARVLGRIKRPESEEALVRLLAVTSDVEGCTMLGMALCALGTTLPDTLDRLRALVSCAHFDPDRGSLDERLLTVCAIQGFQPVDAPAWQERIASREAALEAAAEREADAAAAAAAWAEGRRKR